MSKVILFGCGRGAEVAYKYIKADTEHEICGFTADKNYCLKDNFFGLPLVPFESVETVYPVSEYKMLILLGFQKMNQVRAEKYFQAKEKGYSCISYVHSKLNMIEKIQVGENCFIMENQSINLDVKIGNNVVMWPGNHIGDCSVIKDHVWISSLATFAGDVEIGEYSFLGINASVSNNVTVAPNSYIGASSFITSNTSENGVYVQIATKKRFDDSLRFMEIMEASSQL
jgi:sugar O-acyltransferase (sialic acid O-acetyltransferase NeuD family)